MKQYQVNIRTNNQLENLKLYAKSKKAAIEKAHDCYSGYVKHKFIKDFKIISVYELEG